MTPEQMKKLADNTAELNSLYQKQADLMKQLGKATRIQAVWREAFLADGKCGMFITSLKGQNARFFLENSKEKREITEDQYNFIQGE